MNFISKHKYLSWVINISLLFFSIIIAFFLSEIYLLHRERRNSSLDILRETNQLVGRTAKDIVESKIFFNGCFIDEGIMIKDPYMGYTNVPNVEGYSIRVYGKPNMVLKKPFDLSIFAKNNLRIEAASFRINNLGNRGPNMTVTKPVRVTRIVFLGDSITFGYYVEEEETFAVGVGKQLSRSVSNENKIEILNAGVSSLNARHVLAHLRQRALMWKPDLVFWNFYVNDIYVEGDKEVNVLFPIRRTTWLTPLRRWALGRFIQGFLFSTSIGANISIDTENLINRSVRKAWKDVETYLIQARKILQARNIPLVVVIFPSGVQFSRPWTTSNYQLRLKNICAKHNIPAIDLFDAFKRAGSINELYYRGDLIHPKAIGHAAASSEIVMFLKQNPHLL